MALNTIDILNIISKHQKDNIFKGVYACDTLPSKFTLPAGFVVNLSKKTQIGTHWIALYIDEYGVCIYFDSYGTKPMNNDILRFIKLHSKKVIVSETQIQHVNSVKCGKFASIFILMKMYGKEVDAIVKQFSKNLTVNDKVVENFVRYFNELK